MPVGPRGLVGRDEELALARGALARRGPAGLILSGRPGVGKTALARAVVDDQAARHRPTGWVVGTRAGATIPFGAFAPLFPDAGAIGTGSSSGVELLWMARAALASRGGNDRFVLGVDDAHLLDPASATLTFQLGSTGAAAVVLTTTAGEPVPDAIANLWKDGSLERVELQPLSRPESTALVERLLGGQLDGAFAQTLWELSEGNPLYLRELVMSCRHAGRLQYVGGLWRLDGDIAIGPRLTELLSARLDGLSSPSRELMETIAIAEQVPVEILDNLDQHGALPDLERRQMIEVDTAASPAVARIGHPLFGDVLRNGLPWSRARSVRRQLASSLEAAELHNSHGLLRYVTWKLDAGEVVPADLLVRAARRARLARDPELAERCCRIALEAGGGLLASLFLAEALHQQDRNEEALAVLRPLEPTTDRELADVAYLRARIMWMGLSCLDDAMNEVERTVKSLADSAAVSELVALRASFHLWAGRAGTAAAAALAVIDDDGASPHARRLARTVAATALSWSDQRQRALSVAQRPDENSLDLTTQGVLITLYSQSGRVSELEQVAEDVYEEALRLCDPVRRAQGANARGIAALLTGDVMSAARHFREAALVPQPTLGSNVSAFGQLAMALALSGDSDAAELALMEGRRRVAPGLCWPMSLLEVGAAWVSSTRGDMRRALDALEELARRVRSDGHVAHERNALYSLVLLGRPAPAASRLAELATSAEGPLPRLAAAHARAASARDGSELERIATELADASLNLFATFAAIHAVTAHLDRGDHGRSRGARVLAHRLLESCHGLRPPGTFGELDPVPLTPREREVARLAASGRSSRSIADELVVSVRTIDSHLARVYAKLGISTRRDLAKVFGLAEPGGASQRGWRSPEAP